VLALHIHQFKEIAQGQSLGVTLKQFPAFSLRPQEVALDIVQGLPYTSASLGFVVVTQALLDKPKHAISRLSGLVRSCNLMKDISADQVGDHGLQYVGVAEERLKEERTARVLHTC
jgi:hypothetical protein